MRQIGAFRTLTKTLIVPPAVPQPIAVAEMSAAGFEVAGVARRSAASSAPRMSGLAAAAGAEDRTDRGTEGSESVRAWPSRPSPDTIFC